MHVCVCAQQVRRNMMMMSGRADKTYTTSLGCLKHIMATGGLQLLYKGVFANSVRAIGRYVTILLYFTTLLYYFTLLLLYKGVFANSVRAIGSALVLVIYDELKHFFLPDAKSSGH